MNTQYKCISIYTHIIPPRRQTCTHQTIVKALTEIGNTNLIELPISEQQKLLRAARSTIQPIGSRKLSCMLRIQTPQV